MGRIIEVDHTADVAIRVYGTDLTDLFCTAAEGMLRLMADFNADAPPGLARRIILSAPDVETLLVDWLSELLFLSEEDDCAFSAIQIDHISSTDLRADIHPVRIKEHGHYIKAVTYHEMHVEQVEDEWTTVIVFDL